MNRSVRSLFGLGLLTALAVAQMPSVAEEKKDEDGFVSLFNGKDLTGWRYPGANGKEMLDGKTETSDKRVEVKDGIIVMNEKDKDGKGGIKDLYTVKQFPKDFIVKMEFRASLKSDSGVYVRGPQLQVRDFIRRNEQKQLTNFKNDDWNDLEITVKAGVVTTTVNGKALTKDDVLELTVKDGKPSAKLNGKDIDVSAVQVKVGNVAYCKCNGEALAPLTMDVPANGGIGLQAETGKFEFRNVRVKELK
jgi:hypothetical protein